MSTLTKTLKTIMLFVTATNMLTSCDYWGAFEFTINNRTDKEITISYFEQYRSMEDVLPTYDHREGYESIKIAEADTVVTIQPYECATWTYDVGLVSKDFPTAFDTPEHWDIVPLWQRINYIVLGSDTINASYYTRTKWTRKENEYILDIHNIRR